MEKKYQDIKPTIKEQLIVTTTAMLLWLITSTYITIYYDISFWKSLWHPIHMLFSISYWVFGYWVYYLSEGYKDRQYQNKIKYPNKKKINNTNLINFIK